MAKIPSSDDLYLAADWLEEFESDPEMVGSIEQREQCVRVAAYLRDIANKKASDAQIKDALRFAGVPVTTKTVGALRAKLKKD